MTVVERDGHLGQQGGLSPAHASGLPRPEAHRPGRWYAAAMPRRPARRPNPTPDDPRTPDDPPSQVSGGTRPARPSARARLPNAPATHPPPEPKVAALRRAVLDWYDRSGRTFPFRGATDPWAILVSEAMAQQTQAVRAGEAWTSFIRVYPTPSALAAATPADVLRAWRGLGYNRRALALRAAAIAIVSDHGGRVPVDIESLERLPGVGPYTARAVAALAFGRPVAAVDTNVRRVVRRLAGPAATLPPRELQRFADTLVDPTRPGDWTHALMDVGATACRGTIPRHDACPLEPWCRTAHETAARRQPVARAGTSPVGPSTTGHTRPRRRSRVGEERAPFRSTTRWLRGRLVDRLRDAEDGEWVRLAGTVGEHDPLAVERALGGLERDGLLERHPGDAALVRLPVPDPAGRTAR